MTTTFSNFDDKYTELYAQQASPEMADSEYLDQS